MPPWLSRIIAMAGAALRQALTEKDNATVDIKRVGVAATVVVMLGYKGYDFIFRHSDLAFEATCRGLAELWGVLLAGIAINRNTENGG